MLPIKSAPFRILKKNGSMNFFFYLCNMYRLLNPFECKLIIQTILREGY
jgi:hypothetical protein